MFNSKGHFLRHTFDSNAFLTSTQITMFLGKYYDYYDSSPT